MLSTGIPSCRSRGKSFADVDPDQKLLRMWCNALAGALGVKPKFGGDIPLDGYVESLLARVVHLREKAYPEGT